MSASIEARTRALLLSDPLRMACLNAMADLGLPDGWIVAGFLRNLIWDAAAGHARPSLLNDVDVAYFDRHDLSGATETVHERSLQQAVPEVTWQVRNQARMHVRNGHAPYREMAEAVSFYPEAATCLGARLQSDGSLALLAPYGLADAWDLLLRPSPRNPDASELMSLRVSGKGWLAHWPALRISDVFVAD
ncbi:nucleotidyltransferase family protein [Andreprevotia chitinilytica]|uniref:nucleotidyltransferase family protein n=1 Tax=Andreprevotia chitinilytica TaxID=396808 RepID=UPI00054EAF5C|nr:nucleotidyltransferase family protein [Andreprevotia chitinilytica]